MLWDFEDGMVLSFKERRNVIYIDGRCTTKSLGLEKVNYRSNKKSGVLESHLENSGHPAVPSPTLSFLSHFPKSPTLHYNTVKKGTGGTDLESEYRSEFTYRLFLHVRSTRLRGLSPPFYTVSL